MCVSALSHAVVLAALLAPRPPPRSSPSSRPLSAPSTGVEPTQLSSRSDDVATVVGAAGWRVDPDDPLCDAGRVADELGTVVTTARR